MKNRALIGMGFLVTKDGRPLDELAEELHKTGHLTDEDMAQDGGVSALRRKVYDILWQERNFYAVPASELSEEENQKRLRLEKLQREVNEYADVHGVNDERFMDMIFVPEDLEKFGIEVTGKNIVDAELLAKVLQLVPQAIERSHTSPAEITLRMVEMIKWVVAGRPSAEP